MMKNSAFLMNIARGPIVNKAALTRALKEKWIDGAALDVFWDFKGPDEMYLPADDELWDLENVIISPHTIAVTDMYVPRSADVFCRNLERFLKGEDLFNVIKER